MPLYAGAHRSCVEAYEFGFDNQLEETVTQIGDDISRLESIVSLLGGAIQGGSVPSDLRIDEAFNLLSNLQSLVVQGVNVENDEFSSEIRLFATLYESAIRQLQEASREIEDALQRNNARIAMRVNVGREISDFVNEALGGSRGRRTNNPLIRIEIDTDLGDIFATLNDINEDTELAQQQYNEALTRIERLHRDLIVFSSDILFEAEDVLSGTTTYTGSVLQGTASFFKVRYVWGAEESFIMGSFGQNDIDELIRTAEDGVGCCRYIIYLVRGGTPIRIPTPNENAQQYRQRQIQTLNRIRNRMDRR